MLVRFLRAGPVKHGPLTLHGLVGHVADIDGDDLSAAIASGMVEAIGAETAPEPLRKRGRKPAAERA